MEVLETSTHFLHFLYIFCIIHRLSFVGMHEFMIQEPCMKCFGCEIVPTRVETERAYYAAYLPTFVPYIQFYVIFYYESAD